MSGPPVLIIGAGPTGLVLALCLARHGVPFRIIDRAAGPGQASRAIAVQARTLELYQMLGIADGAVALGIPMDTIRVRRGVRDVVRLSLAGMGQGVSPYPFVLCLAQDDHERYLGEMLRAAGITIEWGVELVGLEQGPDGARATLLHGGREERCETAYVCGCDGAHSRARHALGIGFPGGIYPQSFFVADVQADAAFRHELVMNLGADTLALLLPVRVSGMHRLIGIVPADLRGREELNFEDLRPHIEPLIGARILRVNWLSTYNIHHRVADRFHLGRVFLSGDAGHIHSPAGGQGMNTGIGDAFNLGWKLGAVVSGRAAPALLDTYEPERIAFARRLVATTDTLFRLATGSGWQGWLLRTWGIPLLGPLLTSFARVRQLMFETISQTTISYRGGALAEGSVGRIQAGDRMPLVPPADNFGRLNYAWRAQVFGEANPAFAAEAASLGLSLDVFPWSRSAYRAGLRQGAAYVLRPDGHVGLASPRQEATRLRAYLAQHGLRPGPVPSPGT
jgi:2-polyprenyl-6-methoxyphenol hydroxylase-like FAD-dependent oxidoreductase